MTGTSDTRVARHRMADGRTSSLCGRSTDEDGWPVQMSNARSTEQRLQWQLHMVRDDDEHETWWDAARAMVAVATDNKTETGKGNRGRRWRQRFMHGKKKKIKIIFFTKARIPRRVYIQKSLFPFWTHWCFICLFCRKRAFNLKQAKYDVKRPKYPLGRPNFA